MLIYCILNKINNKRYIGQTVHCAEQLNIDSRKVCACLLGHRKSHKGYIFEVINVPNN